MEIMYKLKEFTGGDRGSPAANRAVILRTYFIIRRVKNQMSAHISFGAQKSGRTRLPGATKNKSEKYDKKIKLLLLFYPNRGTIL